MLNFDSYKKSGGKAVAIFLLAAFVYVQGIAQVFTVDTLMRNGNRSNRVNLVYLSDGYQSAELPAYITNSTNINNALFLQAPFSQYKNFFNSFAVRVPSTQSGAVHPATAGDESSSGGQPAANPTVYFNSTFDYFSIHRLLVPQNSTAIYNVLASNLPDYDQAFIVVNSPYYGGSGGAFATSSIHGSAAEIAIHEIGHSFASLADEYWAGDFYAAEKHNMTQNTNPATVKWKNWYGINSVGIYPYGASGTAAAWYRPHQNCKMQFLGSPFCAVCTEKFIDRIHQLVNMADSYLPATSSFTIYAPNPVSFSVSNINTTASSVTVNWYLNGAATPFATNQSGVNIPYASFVPGTNTVRAEVVDNTTLSKSYLPGIGYINTVSWTVNNAGVLPVRLIDFTGRVNGRNEGLLNWIIESSDDLQKFEIEKSKDGNSFTTLAQVNKQAAERNYAFTDTDLFNPLSYYRLKIFDIDGTYKYSNVISLRNSLEKFAYKVYQDADRHAYRLSCTLNETEKIALVVTDASGKQVFKRDFGKVTGQLNHEFSLGNHPAGVYFLSLQIGTSRYNIKLLAN